MTEQSKYTEAKARANKKWDDKNKERKRYLSYRSSAKGFAKIAEEEDAEKMIDLFKERLRELKNESH